MDRGILNPCKKILTFTTPPFEKDTEVIGQHRARSLCLVRPDGHRVPVPHLGPVPRRGAGAGHAAGRPHPHAGLAEGVARGDQGRGRACPTARTTATTSPQPIEPGKVYKYEIEIWGTSNCFLEGHRLRLDLANGDSNALDFGGHYYGLKVGKDTIYFDKERPSHLVLPVIPSWQARRADGCGEQPVPALVAAAPRVSSALARSSIELKRRHVKPSRKTSIR